MNQLIEVNNSLDSNKWFSTLGSTIIDILRKSENLSKNKCQNNWCREDHGLLICDHITFIDTLIDSQMDFLSNRDCLQSKSLFSLNKNSLIIVSLISGLIWIMSSVASYRPLFGTIICGIVWILFSFPFIYKIYLKQRLIQKTSLLTEKLIKESDLLKKYYKMIEDYEVVLYDDKHNYLTRVSQIKHKLKTFCRKSFIRFREITLDLRTKFPMNSEIDDEINCLCCLPINTFEEIISEDKPNTIISLKSLMHLKRIQQSECFRRIICLFMTICLDNRINRKTDHNFQTNVCKEVLKIFESLIEDSKQNYPQLLSVYNCAKTLWISSEKYPIKCRDMKPIESIETINLLDTNRSIRKELLTALNILDNCDSLIEDGIHSIHSKQFRHQIREEVHSMSSSINSLNRLVSNLEKILRIEELKDDFNSKTSLKCEIKDENPKPLILSSKFEDYVVRDQVFEAIVTQDFDENNVNLDENDDELWEMRLKKEKKCETSHNLFKELKVALKSKADEHKKREAKALGIQLDETNDNSDQNEDQTEDQLSSDILSDKISIDSKQSKTNDLSNNNSNEINAENQNNLFFTSNAFGFQTKIQQKAKLFGSLKETENFGDDTDSDEKEEEN